jgi:hypothetical protein
VRDHINVSSEASAPASGVSLEKLAAKEFVGLDITFIIIYIIAVIDNYCGR